VLEFVMNDVKGFFYGTVRICLVSWHLILM
jgi:hypothetical protein